MAKTSKTVTPEPSITKLQALPIHGLYGILLLFVFASIAYSTYMVAMGASGIVPKVMVIPQAAFAVTLAFVKFYSK